MSVAIYDKALLTKFKRWIKNKDLTVLGVDQTSRLFRYKADITDDKPIQLPLISLSRYKQIITTTNNRQNESIKCNTYKNKISVGYLL